MYYNKRIQLLPTTSVEILTPLYVTVTITVQWLVLLIMNKQ